MRTYTYIHHHPNTSFLIHVISSSSHLHEPAPTCPKYFVEIEEKKKGMKSGQYSTASMNATCTINASQSVSEVFVSKTLRTYTKHAHTHVHIHTKILVLQYFLIAYLQTTRPERTFALQNETAERKGGSYMYPFTIHLLDVLSLCSV